MNDRKGKDMRGRGVRVNQRVGGGRGKEGLQTCSNCLLAMRALMLLRQQRCTVWIQFSKWNVWLIWLTWLVLCCSQCNVGQRPCIRLHTAVLCYHVHFLHLHSKPVVHILFVQFSVPCVIWSIYSLWHCDICCSECLAVVAYCRRFFSYI